MSLTSTSADANAYKTYIVTGGGQDFVRVYAGKVYGIPPNREGRGRRARDGPDAVGDDRRRRRDQRRGGRRGCRSLADGERSAAREASRQARGAGLARAPPPRRTGMRRSRWNASISRKTLRKPPGGSASSTRCGKSRSFVRPTISRLRRVISSNPLRLRASLLGAAGHPDPVIREKSQFRAQHDSLSLSPRS